MNIHRRSLHSIAVLTVVFATTRIATGEDWGTYAIVPVSAQTLVLEAADCGCAEGAPVSIRKPTGGANQRWIITAREKPFFTISPAHDPSLVLAAAEGKARNGTAIVVENYSGQPRQLWLLTKHENASYSLTPKHAPAFGLDHLGGKPYPGAKSDLRTYKANDRHLQWLIKPLAGTGATTPAPGDVKAYEPPTIDPQDILPRTGSLPRIWRVPRRQRPGHVVCLLWQQDLETEGATPRDGRIHTVDESPQYEALSGSRSRSAFEPG